MTSTTIPKHLTTSEVAERLGIRTELVRRWIASGRLKAKRIPGTKKLLIPEPELLRALEEPR